MVEYRYSGNPLKCVNDCRTDFSNHQEIGKLTDCVKECQATHFKFPPSHSEEPTPINISDILIDIRDNFYDLANNFHNLADSVSVL